MKHKIAIGTLLAVMVPFLVAGCERYGDVFAEKINALGTFAQISIVGVPQEQARQAAIMVEEGLLELDKVGYTFKVEGELQQLNEALAHGKSMTVSDGLLEAGSSA